VSAAPEFPSGALTSLERQHQILEMVSEGYSGRAIAKELGLNPRTVWRVLSRQRKADAGVDEVAAQRLLREERHADQLLQALPFEERHEYELEGIVRIMIGGLSIADEDYDPTPAPEGCPSCWRGPGALDGALDGGPCQNCPDPEAKQRCRLERRRGLT
jgi:DNA-binding CsgD family transcriptional regulator